MCLCVRLPVCVSVRVCVCVAVQKMAEAHMQNLGVYPLEDPCEGEEDEEEDASPAKTAGEREALCRPPGNNNTVTTISS